MLHKKLNSFPWFRYSKKLALRIEKPLYVGSYSQEEAVERGVKLVVGSSGSFESGNLVRFYLLIDETDGVIADARFQAYGQSALIGAADIACEIMIRKNYDQAKRITSDLIDKHIRDKKNIPSFPEETFAQLNQILSAIDSAVEQCEGIPLAESYVAPPIHEFDVATGERREFPGWDKLSVKQQIAVVEEVIATDIRPYIELDAGGIEILNLLNSRELIIAYKGSCTSCQSSTGATLSAIQHILRMKVHPEIVVTPDMSFLSPHLHAKEDS